MRKTFCLWLSACLLLAGFVQAQSVTGRVTDATDGSAMPGVTIAIKGTKRGTVTNNDGAYTLQVPPRSTLMFTFVGYINKEITINNNTVIDVALQRNDKLLDEIVVSSYDATTRRKYTGAVSTVSAGKLKDIPAATFDQALQGRVAGLYSTAGSGQPGSANRVVIRGQGTISGSSTPLYIVDGIPIEGSQFASLNTADFESITVLKDANATALYGSRGSNGVIVITTKKGKEGRVVFGLRTQHGISTQTRPRFDMMNAAERLKFEEEIGQETGATYGPGWSLSPLNPRNANLSEADKAKNKGVLDSLRNLNTDWRKIFFRDNARFQEHELTASGGNERTQFYTALNYYKQDGIALRSGLERYSFRTNVDFKGDKFSASVSSAIAYTNLSFIEQENTTSILNPFAAVYYALPYEYPYINGVLVNSSNSAAYNVYDQREGSDALERVLNTTSKSGELKGVISARLKYDLHPHLYARTTVGIDYRQRTGSRYINPNSYTGSQATGRQGSYGESFSRYMQFTSTSGLTYHNSINKHDFEVSALYEFNRAKYNDNSFTGYGLNPLFPETPVGITPGNNTNGFIPVISGRKTGNALASVIAIGKYSYDDKYTLNLTWRRDGSSTVPEKNRWHSFWSVGAGWDLKKEQFLANVNALSTIRLRGSYGLSATPFPSDRDFGYVASYAPTRYDGTPGVTPSDIGNPDYDWEYSNMLNFGIDLAAFKDRLRVTVEWYNKRTSNLFVDQQLSRTSGFTSRRINAGVMRNRGIEVDIAGDVISNKNVTWTIGANFAYNKNEILELGEVNEFVQGTSIIRVGLPIGTHYVVKYAGVNPETGKAEYYSADGKTKSTAYNTATMSVAEFGTYNPPFLGGFNTSVSWKGLTLDAVFSFASGYKRFNNEDFFNQNPSFATSNQSTQWFNRWKNKGDQTDIPAFGDPRRFSSKDIQDASYIRFRNLRIGYSLPKKWLAATKLLSDVQIYASGQNLFTITNWNGFDPEDNNNISTFEYPAARTYTAGVRVNF
ncbi:TonB-dependent receptor [Chitinophaga sp. MD30]|uniref:SusC/RagA family TonB-linked outer membrane protein n=1 Tax=Chitinophaga sp. MD30 TaxID=2033437 RepID=UPI000BB0983B|nr:TonB-dependent receptor [Chitinophaga sp. MD30]ASZ12759.1 SusC/RagA family TonB-linked outer membrane protein [Chitinophaga sp. MD30]